MNFRDEVMNKIISKWWILTVNNRSGSFEQQIRFEISKDQVIVRNTESDKIVDFADYKSLKIDHMDEHELIITGGKDSYIQDEEVFHWILTEIK